MIATLTALLFAHVLADFVFQTNWIATNKQRVPVMLLHGLIVLGTLIAATGSTDIVPLAALTVAHLAIDGVKTYAAPAGLMSFLGDQAAHVATLIATAALAPTLWAGGFWAPYDWTLPVMAGFSGLIIATIAGGYAVGLLMTPFANQALPAGLKEGGKVIGLLERGLVFLLVFVGQPGGIGFLIAAKSVLRFDTTTKDQTASEYVIIGTLASFGWALAVSFATITWLDLLPGLGIAATTP